MLPPMAQAGIYVRISYARAGEIESGVAKRGEVVAEEKQLPPCLALCDRLGWKVSDTYVDPNDSGYKENPSPRVRKQWRRLIEDVKAGRIDAIVAWHPDRLTRQPKENEELIELVDRYGIQVATALVGEHDLASPSGRLHFRMLGNIARYESEHRAERVRVHHELLAQNGRWHGGRRPFGYRYVDGGGIELDDREAGALRDARRRITDDHATLSGIVREWREAGLFQSKGGRPVTVTIADRLLRSPHLLGDRRHHGQVTKQDAWPAVFTTEEHLDLLAELDRRGRKGLVDRHRTLLGGYLFCDACRHVCRGATVKAAGNKREPGYKCDTADGGCGKVHRLAQAVDDEVAARIIRRLANPKLQRKLKERAAGRLTADEAQQVRAAIQADRAKLAQLDALASDLDDAVVDATRATIKARMLEGSRRLRAGVQSGPLAGLPETEAALRRAWEHEWTTDRKREIVAAMLRLPPEGEGITLVPAGRGRRATADHILVDFRL
jgi:site-specific DNA recombinase